jgi:hypothetical protein
MAKTGPSLFLTAVHAEWAANADDVVRSFGQKRRDGESYCSKLRQKRAGITAHGVRTITMTPCRIQKPHMSK